MDKYQSTLKYIKAQTPKLTELRRDLHRYPETGWLEVRTASIIIETLERLGYETITGKAACNSESRFSLPSKEALQAAYIRAGEQGVPDRYRELVKDGFTAVIGVLRCGEGPVIALRFDIDALPITEKDCTEHLPYRDGFRSVNEGCMHACGHDGHTAIGLTVADVLMKMKDQLKGTVKLIFQPAEEGARGAKSIVDRGHLDDVDYLIGAHIMNGSEYDMALGVYGTLATVKLNVTYEGQSAHAGAEPEAGRNALQAAACAVMNLYGIPRNSKGVSRINVGTLHSGNGRNLISDWATMEVEVRGETTEICGYMEEKAVRMIENSARMYEVDYNITKCGGAASIECDAELMDEIRRICADKLSFLRIAPENRVLFGASEDFSYLSQRVKEMGGKATYIPLFTPLSGELHKIDFDYKEEVLKHGVQIFSILVSELLSKSKEKTDTDS